MYRKLLAILLLLLIVGCSVILISKSDNVNVNKEIKRDVDVEADLFSKDSIGKKRKKQ